MIEIGQERARFEAEFPKPEGVKACANNKLGYRFYGHADGLVDYIEYQSQWEGWLAAKRAAVPEGWQVVPVEPTQDMVAGLTGPKGYTSILLEDAYAALLKKAPTPGGDDE